MKLYSIVFAALLLVSVPINILACACCADRGHYSNEEVSFKPYLAGEVSKLIPQSANVYANAGYPDNVIGLGSESDKFGIDSIAGSGIWGFRITDEKKNSGLMSLTKPRRVREMMVDTTPLTERPTVELFKTLTFRGKVKNVSGFLSAGESFDMTYEMVLQGKGNVCTSAGDFTSYSLLIKGMKADYRIFGKVSANEDVLLQKRGDSTGKSVPLVKP